MSKRTLRVTLDLLVSDLTEDELIEAGYDLAPEDEDGCGPPTLADYSADEIAGPLVGYPLSAEAQAEMWAGSEIFARIESARITSANWVSEDHG